MANGFPIDDAGSGLSVIDPLGVHVPIALTEVSVNQRLPSGPVVILAGKAPLGMEYAMT